MSRWLAWREEKAVEAWLAALLIACAFFYFLIFAQFALLHRIEYLDASKEWLQPVMGLMGLGGLIGCLIAWRGWRPLSAVWWIQFGFVGCGVTALLASWLDSLRLFVALGFLVGCFLGALTATLAPMLRLLLPPRRIGRWVGLGTGVAYGLSNVPSAFESDAVTQCILAAIACAVGAGAAFVLPRSFAWESLARSEEDKLPAEFGYGRQLVVSILVFALLVWLDCAAFYAIQQNEALRSASWSGPTRLWTIGFVHLIAAVAAGLFLESGRLVRLLGLALTALVAGSLVLTHGASSSWGAAGALIYVVGVSAYSCALVAFSPMCGKTARGPTIVGRAAALYAFAGWIGSALGVGMARDLGAPPAAFLVVALAGGALGLLWLGRRGFKEEAGR